jgi:hypothetical protein
MVTGGAKYPVSLEIEYPDRDLDRVTTFFRPLVALPVLILLALVSGSATHGDSDVSFEAGGILFLATALMLVVRQKYPRWWFDWNVALTKFGVRVMAYVALLRDEYPSTDEEQAVHVEIRYPDARTDLNRWLPLFKWLLAVPHVVVLALLCVAAVFAVLGAWVAILFTGRYPKGIFDFVVGVLRWWLRVAAYAVLLTTDEYPPFRLAS